MFDRLFSLAFLARGVDAEKTWAAVCSVKTFLAELQ